VDFLGGLEKMGNGLPLPLLVHEGKKRKNQSIWRETLD
jgi:hypothetical protein